MHGGDKRAPQDDQIIDLLRRDVRITRRRIAEETGLPESTIRARLDRILRAGRVKPTILVHPQIERDSFVFMVHLETGEEADTEAILRSPDLIDAPWVGRVATTGELVAQQRATSIEEMVTRLDRIRLLDAVRVAWAVIVFRVYVGSSWQSGGAPTDWAATPTRGIDDIDRRLISVLRRDARTSYTELAESAQLTVAATRRRVLRLVADGVIRFTASSDDEGPAFEASLDLRAAGPHLEALIGDLCARPDVRYVTEQSGRSNVACYVVASDNAALAGAVEAIRADPRIEDLVVSPVVRVRDYLSWDTSA